MMCHMKTEVSTYNLKSTVNDENLSSEDDDFPKLAVTVLFLL